MTKSSSVSCSFSSDESSSSSEALAKRMRGKLRDTVVEVMSSKSGGPNISSSSSSNLTGVSCEPVFENSVPSSPWSLAGLEEVSSQHCIYLADQHGSSFITDSSAIDAALPDNEAMVDSRERLCFSENLLLVVLWSKLDFFCYSHRISAALLLELKVLSVLIA